MLFAALLHTSHPPAALSLWLRWGPVSAAPFRSFWSNFPSEFQLSYLCFSRFPSTNKYKEKEREVGYQTSVVSFLYESLLRCCKPQNPYSQNHSSWFCGWKNVKYLCYLHTFELGS